MSHVPMQFCEFKYIILVVIYVSKWVEAKATVTDNSEVVAVF